MTYRPTTNVARLLGLPSDLVVDLLDDRDAGWKRRRRLVRRKMRELRIPKNRLRVVHNRITRRLFTRLPVHPCSYCAKGRGAVRAGRIHVGHPFLLHLDLKAFFPSVTTDRVAAVFRSLGVGTDEARLLADLVTIDDQLPQGASTSVSLANAVLYRLDDRLSGLARKHGIAYTRYVDDLAFSGGARLSWLQSQIRRIIGQEGWKIGDKGGLLLPNRPHRYLGMILNAKPSLDRTYVRDLRFLATRADLGEHLRVRVRSRLNYIRFVNPRLAERVDVFVQARSVSST